MSLAPWRSSLARALHRNRSKAYSRYPQLATVTPGGRPANRTVVFRRFLDGSDDLTFVTDIRSEKVEQLAGNSAAELCWYFTETREQFRLSGEAQIVSSASPEDALCQIRQQSWENLSNQAWRQFVWPHPGKPRATEGFEVIGEKPDSPVDAFAVLVLTPAAVDHLELKGNPQNRHQYRRDAEGAWHVIEVNP